MGNKNKNQNPGRMAQWVRMLAAQERGPEFGSPVFLSKVACYHMCPGAEEGVARGAAANLAGDGKLWDQ